MVSFCGYFPSEAPKYSCIVCIVKDGLPASGGGQCGPVFSQISQFIMAQSVKRDATQLADSLSVFTPETKTSRANDGKDLVTVPDVEGMGAKDATYLMQKCGLNVVIKGYGTVKLQSIPAGRRPIEGDTVRLTLQP